MIGRIILMFSMVALAGCGFGQHDTVAPTDPALISKLGITQEDWLAIQRLAAERADYVVMNFEKISPDMLELEFKGPADTLGDQGGPSRSI